MLKNRKEEKATAKAQWEDCPDADASVRALFKRGIFMDIIGLDGAGKSSLAMTLARFGKVAYVDIDQSFDRAKKPDNKKERANIKVLPVRYSIPVGMGEDDIRRMCGPVWRNMADKLDEAASWMKGAVIDTGTEEWELLRFASFGTVNPKGNRMDRLYGPVNARHRQMLRGVYRGAGKHLCTIHQMFDEYKDVKKDGQIQSVKTGGHVPSKRFKEIPFLSDLTVQVSQDKHGDFIGTIVQCKLPPFGKDLRGSELTGEKLDFYEIVAMATGTDAEDWR